MGIPMSNQVPQQQVPIALSPALIRAVGGANHAVVWSTINTACAKRGPRTVWHKNGRWYRASLTVLAAETGLVAHQVRYSIQVLEARGFIESTWLDAPRMTTSFSRTRSFRAVTGCIGSC